MVWKGNLRNLLHFLHLRMDAHAQAEIQEFAIKMYEVFVKPLFPVTCDAWENFVRYAVTFSRDEQELLSALIYELKRWDMNLDTDPALIKFGVMDKDGAIIKSKKRKFSSFLDKLVKIGFDDGHYRYLLNEKE